MNLSQDKLQFNQVKKYYFFTWCALLLLNGSSFSLFAKEVQVQTPIRLNALIREELAPVSSNSSSQDASLNGLYWFSISERSTQLVQKSQLLEALEKQGSKNIKLREQSSRLSKLIESLPVTGRVNLPKQDARWLQVNPTFDPILDPGDLVGLLNAKESNDTITVIQEDGTLCTVPFRSKVYTKHYVYACDTKDLYKSDQAWLIEPDGSIHHIGLALWNESTQVRPTPGSWIWAPAKAHLSNQLLHSLPYTSSAEFSEKLSQQFAEFIATQGPSNREGFKNLATKYSNVMDGPALLTESQRYEPTQLPISASDWGNVGLMQTPTARMRESGSVSFTASQFDPYTQYNVMLQPFDSLEFGYRYSKINNRLYGPDIAGSQSYTDKSVDAKVRLLHESYYLPELSVGFRDMVGTGLFSGEYIVGNKRYGPLDFSLGIGFGYLGSRGNIKNPFGIFSSGFNTRPTVDVGQGGNPSLNTYFHGPAALIGGIQYQTPVPRLTLKLELDGNNYQNEPLSNNQTQKSPINIGAVYQMDNTDLSIGFERGNTAMFSISFHENFKKLQIPKFLEPPMLPVEVKNIESEAVNASTLPGLNERTPYTTYPPKTPFNQVTPVSSEATTASALAPGVITTNTPLSTKNSSVSNAPVAPDLPKTIATVNFQSTLVDVEKISGWHATELRQKGNTWILTIDPNTGVYLEDRINKVLSVLHRDAPLSIQGFVLKFQNKSLRIADYHINRSAWMKKQNQLLPPTLAQKADIEVLHGNGDIESNTDLANLDTSSLAYLPNKSYQVTPDLAYQQLVGGPDAFILFALSAQLNASVELWKGAWVSGTGSLRLIDNFGKFSYDAPSNLPRVRTYVREYLTTSAFTIPNLQITQVAQYGDNNFLSAYGGLLEFMYAGVGGEWLYRPRNSKIAVGVDVNQVTQRAFEQNFSLQDYHVTTGHLTTYWDTNWNQLLVKASVGQYLAGDKGYTLDISRVFDNGLKIGGYFTKTNVSAEQFGEGSFDKGIYVSLPFDAFFSKYSGSTATFMYQPLYRDGGAKLYRKYQLFDMTTQRDRNALVFGPPAP